MANSIRRVVRNESSFVSDSPGIRTIPGGVTSKIQARTIAIENPSAMRMIESRRDPLGSRAVRR